MKKMVTILLVIALIAAMPNSIASSDTIKTSDYVTYDYIDTGKQVIVTLKNISKQDVSLTVDPEYTGYDGQEILVYSKDLVTFEAGRTAYVVFDNPLQYKSVKIDVTVNLNYELRKVGQASRIATLYFKCNQICDFFTDLKNNAYTSVNVNCSVVYYKDSKIVYASQKAFTDFKSGHELWFAENSLIPYDTFSININEAY